MYSKKISTPLKSDTHTQQGPMYFNLCRLYPFSSPSHHGSVWVLSVIFLMLTNNVTLVRAWDWERFRGAQKEDECGPLSIQSSLEILKEINKCIFIAAKCCIYTSSK
jgi:hypothetical protein